MANLYRITPFMHVPDIDAAITFFTEILGFTCRFRQGTYAYVQREVAAFRLLEVADVKHLIALIDVPFRGDLRELDALIAAP